MTWLIQSLTLVPTTTSGKPFTDSCSITCNQKSDWRKTMQFVQIKENEFSNLFEGKLCRLRLPVHVSKHPLKTHLLNFVFVWFFFGLTSTMVAPTVSPLPALSCAARVKRRRCFTFKLLSIWAEENLKLCLARTWNFSYATCSSMGALLSDMPSNKMLYFDHDPRSICVKVGCSSFFRFLLLSFS